MKANRNITLAVWTKPNKARRLFEIASACRFVWNWAVAKNKEEMERWENGDIKERPDTSFYSLASEFTALRHAKETNWLLQYPYVPIKHTLKKVSNAFNAFYRDVKQGRPLNASPPKFHNRSHKLWITFPAGSFKLTGSWLHLSRIGWIKMVKPQRVDRYKNWEPKQVHMRSDDGHRWYAVISIECDIEDKEEIKGVVGLDLNVGQYAMPSHIIKAPDRKRLEARTRRYQRQMARRKKGSNRYKQAKNRAAKSQRKLAGRQRNWHHHESQELSDLFGTIVVEDLKLKNLTKSAKGTVDEPGVNVKAKAGLNRELRAMAWGQFKELIRYKANRLIEIDPRYTSQRCHKCGHTAKENRKSQSQFVCVVCHHRDNADLNAAKNIKAAGKRLLDAEAAGTVPACETSRSRQPETSKVV